MIPVLVGHLAPQTIAGLKKGSVKNGAFFVGLSVLLEFPIYIDVHFSVA
jgi:hypothetical protein